MATDRQYKDRASLLGNGALAGTYEIYPLGLFLTLKTEIVLSKLSSPSKEACQLPERAISQSGEKGEHDRVMPSEMYYASPSAVVGKRRNRRKTCMWWNHHTTLFAYKIIRARLLTGR